MTKSLTAEQLAPHRQTTTVFTCGNSQAVRLPKAFRFTSKTVQIERRGDEIVLREKPLMVKDVIGMLPPIEGMPDHMPDELPGDAPSMEGVR
jgi:antitoxin VapB